MSTADVKLNPYDEVVFPSQPLPQSHPDRLAAVARLLGMDPPPPERSRVLELGCATGGNIIPMADRLRGSQFVGIDYSRAQVQIAERMAAQLETRNIELLQADIAQLGTSLGQFDYIICHGVFSWVPEALQGKILELVRDSLTPQGVAYISYNTQPGWYLRGVLRQMLEKFAPEGLPAAARLAKGRALLEFFKSSAERQDTAYARLLQQEIEGIFRHPDGYIFHEYFESENRPLYFHQFAALAGQYRLQYLGETNVATMFSTSYGPMAEMQLGHLQLDIISTEQHFDILRNRGFRQSLLCRADAPVNRTVTTAPLSTLYFHGKISARDANSKPFERSNEQFTTASGLTVSVDAPELKTALCILGEIWPRAASFEELAHEVDRRLSANSGTGLSAEARHSLAENLVHCIASGLVEINSLPDDFTTAISERPAASRLARFEAQFTKKATNRRHQLVDLDEVTRTVLWYLDGNRDRAALLGELTEAVNRGDVSILIDGTPATGGEAVRSVLGVTLEQSLSKLARNALLIR